MALYNVRYLRAAGARHCVRLPDSDRVAMDDTVLTSAEGLSHSDSHLDYDSTGLVYRLRLAYTAYGAVVVFTLNTGHSGQTLDVRKSDLGQRIGVGEIETLSGKAET